MKIKATLTPGQNGTKQPHKHYSDQLVCIRYRYDKSRQKRLKPVERIVDEQDWIPGVGIPPDRRVPIRIGLGESDLSEQVKQAGGYRNPEKRLGSFPIIKCSRWDWGGGCWMERQVYNFYM